MEFGRLLTALATPFAVDGSLDIPGLRDLTNHCIRTGSTAIVACGTTGESPTLSKEEKLDVFRAVLDVADGRVPVVAGTSGNSTRDAILLSQAAEQVGVDALLLVAPYYNRPSQDGLYEHFAHIAAAVSIPIIIYNIPGRCGVNVETQTLLKLADIPNIVGVKEASADIAQIAHIAADKPDDFLLYSGDDKLTLPVLSLGGYGVVSVASHIVGEEMAEMIDLFLTGDVQTAAVWNGRLLPLFDTLFRVSSPAPLKAALRLMGLAAGGVRLPLVDAPDAVVYEIERQLLRIGKIRERNSSRASG